MSIRYGDSIQLQHVKSGAFVTALESAALLDSECRGVSLSHMGSSAAVFKFMPRFKFQTEGSDVFFSHTVVVESCKQRGTMLHNSEVISWYITMRDYT